MLAFFFSPEKEHPLRTTLMTSSKRHWGQRAVSHLVLYTNLKKKTKQQRHKGERKQRRNNFRKKQGCEFWRSGASDGSGSELANPSGLLWSPSLSGGGGYGGLWSEPTGSLKIHSAGACLCVRLSLCHRLQLDHRCPSPPGPTSSPPTSTSVNLRQEFSPQFPDWHLYEVG